MNYVYILLGTNLFNRLRNLSYAIYKINEFSKIIEISSIYETEPFGYRFQNSFLNVSILIATNLNPYELLNATKRIENLMDRKKLFLNSPRIIDIDILIFNDYKIDSEYLKIPHKALYERKFFVLPMLEIISRGYRDFGFDINNCSFKDGWISLYSRNLQYP